MRKERRKTKQKKKIIIILAILIIILTAYIIYKTFQKNNGNNENIIEQISQYVSITDDEINVDFKGLKELNKDTIAYIKIDGTNIQYPVVKTDNNDYYQNHSYDKKENEAGWIYSDSKNKVDGMDKNLVIYGNNGNSDDMFGPLNSILTSGINTITLAIENQNLTYEIFSTYKIKEEKYYNKTDFNNKNYKDFIDIIKSRTLKDYKLEPTQEDRIITLVASNPKDEYKIVIHAKRTK